MNALICKNLFRFASLLRTSLFWVITQQVVVISYQRFGETYLSHPQGSGILQGFFKPEDGTYKLSRNISKKLPLLAT
jgi:hypothetical protein